MTTAKPITGACVWTKTDLTEDPSWRLPWPGDAADEIDRAWRHVSALGLAAPDFGAETFPLPSLGGFFDDVRRELEDGRGVVRLTGFPVRQYDPGAIRTIFWGIGCHLGTAIHQTAAGEIIGEVRDESSDGGRVSSQLDAKAAGDGAVLASRARARSSGPLRFHTDRCDAIALLCVRNGISGGVSKLASIPYIHNEILRRRPDLHDLLCHDYWRSRPDDEDGPGREKVFALPVFGVRDGKLTSQYSRTYVEQAQEFDFVPRLTADQNAALDLLAEIAEESCLHSPFEEGDIQILNNHVVYHGRTAYEDDAGAGQSRLLLRLWLSMPNSRALPEGHEILWRRTEAGAVRGGVELAS